MEDIKTSIERLLQQTNRAGMDNLLVWMDENGFYDAPCSGKYHLSKPGGLAEHSMNVFRVALPMAQTLLKDDSTILSYPLIDAIVICSLLHDLGKVGQFDKPNYIKNEDPQRGAYKTNKDLLYVPHEVRSIAIASQFIKLTEEEQFAILYHNGLYGELQAFKGHETALYMILHFADMWASRIVEKE